MSEVTLRLNGREQRAIVPEGATLAELLREQVGLTGTKIACGEGTCGACTVLRRRPRGALVHPARRAGRGPRGHDDRGPRRRGRALALQRAFVEEDALQCGFCTAGQVVSATALLAADAASDERAGARRA